MRYALIKKSTDEVVRYEEFATSDDVPVLSENKDLLWLESPEPPPAEPSIAELKESKNAEINAARLIANQSSFTHQGKQIACDLLSRSDIDAVNGHVGTRNAMPPNWIGGWKAVDNSIVMIPNVDAWNAFYDSMILAGQINFAKSQTLKSQLEAASTAEQVAAIAW